jgi:hypothetical protein
MGALGGMMVIVWLFLLILAILWFLMPFAVFGTKGVLKELIAEQKKTNRLLEEAAARAQEPVTSLMSPEFRS